MLADSAPSGRFAAMNGDARRAPDAGGGVPSLFAGFNGLPGGARVIATRTTTTHVAQGGGGASAAMHFDQLKSLALSMGMAASAGAARKQEAEGKANAAAQKLGELEKQLAEKQREVRRGCCARVSRATGHALRHVLGPAWPLQVDKLQDNAKNMQKAQEALAVKQSNINTQFEALHNTLLKNHAKMKQGALSRCTAHLRCRPRAPAATAAARSGLGFRAAARATAHADRCRSQLRR